MPPDLMQPGEARAESERVLDLQALGKTSFEAAQGGGIRVLHGVLDELVEQLERVVGTDLGNVARACMHGRG